MTKIGLILALLSSSLVARGAIVPVAMKDEGKGFYIVESHFLVHASSKEVWDALTDYEHIPDFISSMRVSRIVGRHDGCIFLEQESVGRVFVFKKKIRVVLKINESPLREIAFEDVSKSSFDSYKGFWRLRETSDGIKVSYRLSVESRFIVPRFIFRGAWKRATSEMMGDVRGEIERRSRVQPSNLVREGEKESVPL